MLNCIDPAVFFYSSADYFGPTWDRIKSIELRASSKASNDLFRRLQQITSNVSQTGSHNNTTDKRCFFSQVFSHLLQSDDKFGTKISEVQKKKIHECFGQKCVFKWKFRTTHSRQWLHFMLFLCSPCWNNTFLNTFSLEPEWQQQLH